MTSEEEKKVESKEFGGRRHKEKERKRERGWGTPPMKEERNIERKKK